MSETERERERGAEREREGGLRDLVSKQGGREVSKVRSISFVSIDCWLGLRHVDICWVIKCRSQFFMQTLM